VDADRVGVVKLLIAAEARVEPANAGMATPPLAEWLAGA
jgi:hypothetical protein